MEDRLKTAILLLGHGSNLEDANESLHGVGRMIKADDDCYIGAAACLSLARPSISEGIESCIGKGAKRIVVIPYFLYMGHMLKRISPMRLMRQRKDTPVLISSWEITWMSTGSL